MTARRYRYLGPADLATAQDEPPERLEVTAPGRLAEWGRRVHKSVAGECTVTFVVTADGRLWIADRHSEHVQCARGAPVLTAGELTFSWDGASAQIESASNQSTGYCPEPSSFRALEAALEGAGLDPPPAFAPAFDFRRCPACEALNLVKDQDFTCSCCGEGLPLEWNCDSARE